MNKNYSSRDTLPLRNTRLALPGGADQGAEGGGRDQPAGREAQPQHQHLPQAVPQVSSFSDHQEAGRALSAAPVG